MGENEKKALHRCISEVQGLIYQAADLDFDEMTVAALQTAIESMQLRLSAAPPAEPGGCVDGACTAEQLAQWLEAKYRRHGEDEDRQAAAMLRSIAAPVQSAVTECPACPVEVRDLLACVHNFMLDPTRYDKLQDVRESHARLQKLADRHFSDPAHSHPYPGHPRAALRPAERGTKDSDHD